MPQIYDADPGLSALGGASESVEGQMALMGQMQQIAGMSADVESARRDMASEDAFAEFLQAQAGGQPTAQADFSQIKGFIPQSPQEQSQESIRLAGRLTNPKHAAMFLEVQRDKIEQARLDEDRGEFANVLAASGVDQGIIDSLLEVADSSPESGGGPAVARKLFAKHMMTQGDTIALQQSWAEGAEYITAIIPSLPFGARSQATALAHAVAGGAMTSAQWQNELNRIQKYATAEQTLSEAMWARRAKAVKNATDAGASEEEIDALNEELTPSADGSGPFTGVDQSAFNMAMAQQEGQEQPQGSQPTEESVPFKEKPTVKGGAANVLAGASGIRKERAIKEIAEIWPMGRDAVKVYLAENGFDPGGEWDPADYMRIQKLIQKGIGAGREEATSTANAQQAQSREDDRVLRTAITP